ncbi:MAG: WG repeat-containing protein [Saprospiraceae bacterium]|nr:WG repeat-containing protein [Saprospiraceae bacterium]
MKIIPTLLILIGLLLSIHLLGQQNVKIYDTVDSLILEKKYKEALPILISAAEKGSPEAQLRLGVFYLTFTNEDISKDEIEGFKWIRKSAEQGNIQACSLIGMLYLEGRTELNISKDFAEAAKWFQKAAVQGDKKAKENYDEAIALYYASKSQKKYDWVYPFEEGLGRVRIDKKYRDSITYQGKKYVEFKWQSEKTISKYGLIDTNGIEIVLPTYDYIGSMKNGFAIANIGCIATSSDCKGGKSGIINKKGELVCPLVFDMIDTFSEGFARVNLGGKWNDDLWFADFKGGQWGFIDETGKSVISTQFEYVGNFHEGLALIKQNGKWGYINKKGDITIPCLYDVGYDFNNGLALVSIGGVLGTIGGGKGEKTPVGNKGFWGIINKKGKEVG